MDMKIVDQLDEWVKNTEIRQESRIFWADWINDGSYREIAKDLGVDSDKFKERLVEADKFNYSFSLMVLLLTKDGRPKNLKYRFLIAPGHGYLIVPKVEVDQAVQAGVKISEYSSVVGDKVYLEEDCDAPAFMDWGGISTREIEFKYGDFASRLYPSYLTK